MHLLEGFDFPHSPSRGPIHGRPGRNEGNTEKPLGRQIRNAKKGYKCRVNKIDWHFVFVQLRESSSGWLTENADPTDMKNTLSSVSKKQQQKLDSANYHGEEGNPQVLKVERCIERACAHVFVADCVAWLLRRALRVVFPSLCSPR